MVEPAPLRLSFARPGATLTTAPPQARWIFRGDRAAAAACGESFGVALPSAPLRAHEASGRVAIWLGPDEWLLKAAPADAGAVAAAIAAALRERPHSLVDVSHRQIALRLEGPLAARALNGGCPLDLALAAFPQGAAARTLCGGAEIVLRRLGAEAFEIEVWRSFAPYVADLLADAARGAPL